MATAPPTENGTTSVTWISRLIVKCQCLNIKITDNHTYINKIHRSDIRWSLLMLSHAKAVIVKIRKSFVCTSSFWSALAAIFAAIAAFLSYSQQGISLSQQQLTLLNSVRPELVLSEWYFSSDPNSGKILIGSIENIGVSPALNVHLSLTVKGDTTDNSPPKAWIVGDPISIISTDTNTTTLREPPVTFDCLFEFDADGV